MNKERIKNWPYFETLRKTCLNITWYPSWTGCELSCDQGWSGMLFLGPRRRMGQFCNGCGAPWMCRIAVKTGNDQKCENKGIMRRGCCNCCRGWFPGLDIVRTHHRPPVVTRLSGLQCLPVQHLCTDSSLSFASKMMFSGSFQSILVLYHMPVQMYQCQASIATSLPASQCLPVPHLSTDSSLSFASKIMSLGWFESFLGMLLYSGADVSMPGFCSYRSASLTMPSEWHRSGNLAG